MSGWHFELKPDSVVSLTYREMNFLLASFNSLFWLYSSQLYCCAPLSQHLQLRLFIFCSISVKINWLCTSCCWRLEHAAAKEENDTCSRLCVRDYSEYLSKRALKPPATPPHTKSPWKPQPVKRWCSRPDPQLLLTLHTGWKLSGMWGSVKRTTSL